MMQKALIPRTGQRLSSCSLRNAYPVENLHRKIRSGLRQPYFGEIYIMNADGSDQKQLTNWSGYDGGPFFSPDGERIIWRHFNENGMLADVYTMKLDGSDIRRLTDFKSMSWAPYFHPSGEYVIFHSNKLGFTNCELFIVDARGEKEPIQVTFTDGFDGLPVFAPDGRHLAWTSGRTTTRDSQLFYAEWNHDAALEALKLANKKSSLQPAQTFGIPESSIQVPVDKTSTPQKTGHHFSPEITEADLRAEVGYLASDELEGRLTGTKGARMSANYIADYFQKIGLKPQGDKGSYCQEFPFIAGTKIIPDQNHLCIIKEAADKEVIQLEVNRDFVPLALTSNGEAEGQVVFAGYGLSVPGTEGKSYDSYAGIDVKDKIVLVLNHVPEKVDTQRHLEFSRYSGLRYKAMLAREHGAKALLVINGPKSQGAGELIALSSDKESANSGIIAASISGKAAEAIFAGSAQRLDIIQSRLDVEEPRIEGGGFELPNVRIKISAAIEQVKDKDRNVLGILPPAQDNESAEYVMVGAHYDHIGHGGADSLAREGEKGQVHNGADDNASGVSTILELAAFLAEERVKNPQLFKRGVIFALWSGEELGFLGSSYFADHPTVPLKNAIAYINYDMVGRLRDNTLILEGIGSSNTWGRLIEKNNVSAGFNLKLLSDPYLPTDVTAFYPKGIPVIHFFTGVHEDYNRPTDDAETLNYEGMTRIAQFSKSMIVDLIKNPERPDYVKVAQPGEASGKKVARKSYWGTVPDFAYEGKEGVRIANVKQGGPAEKAGMKSGDIVVEIAGKKITNIYDYNYMMDSAGIGQPVEIIVLRDGKRETLSITPEARK
ncbi:MAG: M28 family peptidase [Candidatus Brocadiaceae bacterium]